MSSYAAGAAFLECASRRKPCPHSLVLLASSLLFPKRSCGVRVTHAACTPSTYSDTALDPWTRGRPVDRAVAVPVVPIAAHVATAAGRPAVGLCPVLVAAITRSARMRLRPYALHALRPCRLMAARGTLLCAVFRGIQTTGATAERSIARPWARACVPLTHIEGPLAYAAFCTCRAAGFFETVLQRSPASDPLIVGACPPRARSEHARACGAALKELRATRGGGAAWLIYTGPRDCGAAVPSLVLHSFFF